MNQQSNRIDPFVLLTTAHVAMLGKQGLIDDAAVQVLAGAIDRIATSGHQDESDPIDRLMALDARVDTQLPPGFAGAAGVGRGINEMIAAYARVVVRDALLDLADSVAQLREDLIDLAMQHVVTIMPAYQQGMALQPTTLGHLLGASIGPYDRVHGRIRETYALVNQSPLGAGAMVSTGLRIDREDAAANAGFDGVIENTFDAVAAVDHFSAVSDLLRATASPIGRLVRELSTIYRTDPSSMLTHDAAPRVRNELPQHSIIPAFDELERLLIDLDAMLETIDRWIERAPLEPIAEIGQPLGRLLLAFETMETLIGRFRDFVNRELAFNRAYLANRANYNYTTIGELADYLMLEHQISPAQARDMTARVMSQLREEGREVGGVTATMIDTAGMMVLGRELGIEIESLGKYLAPRRFIERRAGFGGPAPSTVRSWLSTEQASLARDRTWISDRRTALDRAAAAMHALAVEE